MKYFMLIWAGLWRKPTRTILTMLSIVVAFLLFGVLQGFNQGINSALGVVNNRLWSTAQSSRMQSIPLSHMAAIKTVPGVIEVAHMSFFGGYFQDSKNAIGAYAVNIDAFASVYPELNISQENVHAMQALRTGVLIGAPLALKYGWKVGDKIPLGTTIWTNTQDSNSWQFDIVGIYHASPEMQGSPLDNAFWINYDYFDEARRFDRGRMHQFIIAIKDPQQAAAISSSIDKLFENSGEELRTQTEIAALQQMIKQLADINFIVNAIVGAVLFTLLFLTANTMMQSVRERIPELAVLRTLGFSSSSMLTLVLVESFILCAFAAMFGLLLAAGIVAAVGKGFGIASIPPIVVAFGLGLAALLALVSGLLPGWRAKQLTIVDALAGR
jgi:putative ABC transport system permease protein